METVLPNGDVLRIEVDLVDVSSAIDGRGYFHTEIPGRVSYFLNDRPISEKVYLRFLVTAVD